MQVAVALLVVDVVSLAKGNGLAERRARCSSGRIARPRVAITEARHAPSGCSVDRRFSRLGGTPARLRARSDRLALWQARLTETYAGLAKTYAGSARTYAGLAKTCARVTKTSLNSPRLTLDSLRLVLDLSRLGCVKPLPRSPPLELPLARTPRRTRDRRMPREA